MVGEEHDELQRGQHSGGDSGDILGYTAACKEQGTQSGKLGNILSIAPGLQRSYEYMYIAWTLCAVYGPLIPWTLWPCIPNCVIVLWLID